MHFLGRTLIFCVMLVFAACASVAADEIRPIDDSGYFTVRYPQASLKGAVIGVPHAAINPNIAGFARAVSEATGAGFIGAHGFQARRITVEQPRVRRNVGDSLALEPKGRGSVFSQFHHILTEMTGGDLRLYVGLRARPASLPSQSVIEAAASGFSLEELALVKSAFNEETDRYLPRGVPRHALAIAPLDDVRWDSAAFRHHGILLIAKRGLMLRLPQQLAKGQGLSAYQTVIAAWLRRVHSLAQSGQPGNVRLDVATLPFGRMDVVPSRKNVRGVAIGAPHGSFDEHTAELVRNLSQQTGFGAVIAKGFSPTQAGGWRINVNRPSEKNFLAPEREIKTERAGQVYEFYKKHVIGAAGGRLQLYLDVHQYGLGEVVQVATVGISRSQARDIKRRYSAIRDRLLNGTVSMVRVPLQIEPDDNIEIGAWPAKAEGILAVAEKSLHFELPAHTMLRSAEARRVYGQVLSELIAQIPQLAGL